MIIIASLVISFFIVLLINGHSKKRSDEALVRSLLSIIQQMELYSSLNPEGMAHEDHVQLGGLVKGAEKLAEKTGKILVILLAKKMTNVYDSLKVKGS